jgi:hypothetical protein
LLLANYVAEHYPQIRYLFHGAYADGFNGGAQAARIIHGDKYRSWPIAVLDLLAAFLAPISDTKSYGARTAAEVLKNNRNIHAPSHNLNAVDLYTDWKMVEKCFPPRLIDEVFAGKRTLLAEYLDSKYMVEQVSTLDTLVSGLCQHGMERILGYFCGMTYIYPYGDEAVIAAGCSFDPFERYIHKQRTKPILKMVLESQAADFQLDKPKGWSGYGMVELFEALKVGELAEMVHAIERPGFMSQADFEQKLDQPDWFTWNLLTLDLLKKHVLAPAQQQQAIQSDQELSAPSFAAD